MDTPLDSPVEKVNIICISPFEKERFPFRSPSAPHLRQVFAEQLAESEGRPLSRFTARSISPPVRFPGKVTAVVGMRRAGRTTFLHQLRSESVERSLRLRRSPYISFEDERLAVLGAGHLGLLVGEYHRRSPDSGRSTPAPGISTKSSLFANGKDSFEGAWTPGGPRSLSLVRLLRFYPARSAPRCAVGLGGSAPSIQLRGSTSAFKMTGSGPQ